jgi:hypothetical protein
MRPWALYLLVLVGSLGLVLCGTSYWGWSPVLLKMVPGVGIGVGAIFAAWFNNRLGPKQVKNLVWLSASMCAGVAVVLAFNFLTGRL